MLQGCVRGGGHARSRGSEGGIGATGDGGKTTRDAGTKWVGAAVVGERATEAPAVEEAAWDGLRGERGASHDYFNTHKNTRHVPRSCTIHTKRATKKNKRSRVFMSSISTNERKYVSFTVYLGRGKLGDCPVFQLRDTRGHTPGTSNAGLVTSSNSCDRGRTSKRQKETTKRPLGTPKGMPRPPPLVQESRLAHKRFQPTVGPRED